MARDARHVRVQRQGKERDRYICQVCGSRERLEGHHIVDYHFGGAADKNNIITLCHECHRKCIVERLYYGFFRRIALIDITRLVLFLSSD